MKINGLQKLVVLLPAMLLGTSITGQVKHAPTVEVCTADQRLWWDELQNSRSLPDYEILDGWFHEMLDCTTVDPDHRLPYLQVVFAADNAKLMRVENYLHRHNLYDAFIAEDKAGKR